jgi:HlyD family secretion protein
MPSKTTLIVGIVAASAAAGYWYFGTGDGVAAIAGYQTEPASIGRIESLVNTAGTISPVVTVDVGSELSGLVRELHADFNSEVKSGQIIARIDDRTILAKLRQIEADVSASHASLAQQRANTIRAAADLEFANSEVVRQRELVARQLSSASELDRSEANLKIAAANLEVARSQVLGAEASVQQREAQLDQAQLDLERTYIRSPVDGTVIDRQVDVGQTVAASLSAPILFQIAQDLTQMQIEADVDEADIGRMTDGLVARFTVDAFPERTFIGAITQVRKAATITNNVVTYKVIVGAENPRQQLLPGMTANVNIVLGEKDDVLRVSNSALRFNPPGVEAGAANGFGGGGGFGGDAIAGQVEEMSKELELTAEQKRAVETALEEMQNTIAELREGAQGGRGFGGGGFRGGGGNNIREQFQRTQQRMTIQLTGVLSAEQLQKFQAALGGGGGGAGGGRGGFAGRGGGGNGQNPDFANMRRGQVWVLDGDEPRAVRVLVGLSDSQFTEVVSDEIEAGDPVIVRVAR